MSLDAGEEMLRHLYPEPLQIEHPTLAAKGEQFLALPSYENARMFLPADPRLACLALRRARHPVSRRGRIVTALASLALRAGLGRWLGSTVSIQGNGECINDVLLSVVGRPFVSGIFLGPPRANRKPVVQAISPDGQLIAVAKVGVTPLASRLAEAEAAALRALANVNLPHVVLPRLLGEAQWRGQWVVVQSALPVWELGTRSNARVVYRAMREISACLGVETEAWVSSNYRNTLNHKIVGLRDDVLRGFIQEVVRDHVSSEMDLPMGSWHGDLSKFNFSVMKDGRVLVWDWERFSRNVPVGFDFLHFCFMPRLERTSKERSSAGVWLISEAPRLLGPLGHRSDQARAVAVLYLAEIATRFSADEQAATGTPGGKVGDWFAPLLGELTRQAARSENG